MDSSRYRLMNTRFFDDVNIVVFQQMYQVVGVAATAKEGRTGNLTFG